MSIILSSFSGIEPILPVCRTSNVTGVYKYNIIEGTLNIFNIILEMIKRILIIAFFFSNPNLFHSSFDVTVIT